MSIITDAATGVNLVRQFSERSNHDYSSASDAYTAWALDLNVSSTESKTVISPGDDVSTSVEISTTRNTFLTGSTSYVSCTSEGGWTFYLYEPSSITHTSIPIKGSAQIDQSGISRYYERGSTRGCLVLSTKQPTQDAVSKGAKWNGNGDVAIFYSEFQQLGSGDDPVHTALRINMVSGSWDVVTNVTSANVKFQVLTLVEGGVSSQATHDNNGQTFDLFGVQYFSSSFDDTITGVVTDNLTGNPVQSNVIAIDMSDFKVLASTVTDEFGTFGMLAVLDDVVDLGFTFQGGGYPLATAEVVNDSSVEPLNVDLLYNLNTNVGTPPAFSAIVAGNVTKLGVPYGAKIVIMSDSDSPNVVGYGQSNSDTGNYSIDVAPWTSEVLIAVIPDYGVEFTEDAVVNLGQIIHPPTPNGYVYKVTTGGTMGSIEPIWNTDTPVVSGAVTMSPEILHRPLMNGFVKPVLSGVVIRGVTLSVAAGKMNSQEIDFTWLFTEVNLPEFLTDGGLLSFLDGGGNIKCYTDSGKSERLPIEVVKCEIGDIVSIIVWGKSPSLGVGQSIYVEADVIATAQPLVTAEFGRNAVWADNLGVFHLEDNTDSTGKSDAVGVLISETGQVGKGASFASTVNTLETEHLPSIPSPLKRISLWIKPADIISNAYLIDDYGSNDLALIMGYQEGYVNIFSNTRYPVNNNPDLSKLPLTADVWQHIVYTTNGTILHGYVNGVRLVTQTANLTDVNFTGYNIGGNNANYLPNVHLDEFNFAHRFASDGEVFGNYNNQSDPATFWITE